STGCIHSARMRQFLQLVVESSLSGGVALKETVIGIEVFGRAADYDSGAEPIVRVEARRLRQKLQQYYEGQGAGDEVVIRLPKGGYTPEFDIRPAPPLESAADRAPAMETAPPNRRASWPGSRGAMTILAGVVTAILIGIVWGGRASDRGVRPATVSDSPAKSAAAWASQPFVSIAVLPLANLSGDSAQDYLADGMTDELIGSLAQVPSLRVISRTS